MKHPAYHLRPNKAIDRVLLLKIMERLDPEGGLSGHTYFGFGGPFLDDVRLIAQQFPAMKCVSIERDVETHKRQQFHMNTKNLTLIQDDLASYLKQDFAADTPCIFWLDYTDLRLSHIEEFMELLQLVGPESIVKVTVPAQAENPSVAAAELLGRAKTAKDLREAWIDKFQRKFHDYLPGRVMECDLDKSNCPPLVQGMFQIAAQKALPAHGGSVFQLVHSCRYADGAQMLTLTGVVCEQDKRPAIVERFREWRHSNTDWQEPEQIDVPDLSVKERLLLEKHLPAHAETGETLRRALGYDIDKDQDTSERKLRQYQEFYQFYPLFAKVTV